MYKLIHNKDDYEKTLDKKINLEYEILKTRVKITTELVESGTSDLLTIVC